MNVTIFEASVVVPSSLSPSTAIVRSPDSQLANDSVEGFFISNKLYFIIAASVFGSCGIIIIVSFLIYIYYANLSRRRDILIENLKEMKSEVKKKASTKSFTNPMKGDSILSPRSRAHNDTLSAIENGMEMEEEKSLEDGRNDEDSINNPIHDEKDRQSSGSLIKYDSSHDSCDPNDPNFNSLPSSPMDMIGISPGLQGSSSSPGEKDKLKKVKATLENRLLIDIAGRRFKKKIQKLSDDGTNNNVQSSESSIDYSHFSPAKNFEGKGSPTEFENNPLHETKSDVVKPKRNMKVPSPSPKSPLYATKLYSKPNPLHKHQNKGRIKGNDLSTIIY